MISRLTLNRIISRIEEGKRAVIILGPRRCGKTTLLHMIVERMGYPHTWFNGDDPADARLLEESSVSRLRTIIGKSRLMIIDEAQNIANIGKIVKLITDHLKQVSPVISGSSAFELANEFNEPLTGRKYEYMLFPFSFAEMVNDQGLKNEIQQIENRLIFGSYPEIVNHPGDEKELLMELSTSYLYKDIFKYGGIKKPNELEKIVQNLAWQLGSEVVISELARSSGVSAITVERYLDLLEKTFVIFRLPALARNLRNEIKKSKKVYFFDNGVRNAIIGNFNLPGNRNDIGPLWENYLVSERMKFNHYRRFYGSSYFWRTNQQQEIDYIEESDGKFSPFEFKWNLGKHPRFPATFLRNYPVSETVVVTPSNIEQFLT
ncbi:MAG: ATP-binding protein [Bacteroidetes bacterium]|nr:MAG: ATP-binding protein [Bacteroidota bacterium]